MAFRQPVPSWARRRQQQQDAEREAAFNDKLGNLMDFDDRGLDTSAPPPIIQVEHHIIGRDFILAGRAVFTVTGKQTRFTYKVNRKESENPRYPNPTYFVSVLTGGADAEHSYTYLGILDARNGAIKFTKGSRLRPDTPAAKALRWTLARVWAGQPLPAPAAIYHEGRCGRCGRPLTVPESILTGFGPECAGLIGVPYGGSDDNG